MLIYNTTFHVEGEAQLGPFLTFMRDVYVPAAIRDGYLRNPRFVRLLTDLGDNLFGYALMCEVEDVQTLKRWKHPRIKLPPNFRRKGPDVLHLDEGCHRESC